jgi:hypothetical protein
VERYSVSLWDNQKLVRSLSPTLGLRLMETRPLTDAAMNPAVNLTTSQTAFNPVITTPGDANGFAVTFDPLATLTDTVLSWDDANSRVRIETGTVTGAEPVTVRFTNSDGTEVARDFTLTVA